MTETLRLPLRRKDGTVVAFATIDATDAALAQHRWSLSGNYVQGRPGGRAGRGTSLHRLILGLRPGDGKQVDHINGDPLDNRRSNLRVATPAQNAQNRPGQGGSSRYRGVYWERRRQRWGAYVMVNRRQRNLGSFDSEEQAALVASRYRVAMMEFTVEERRRAPESV